MAGIVLLGVLGTLGAVLLTRHASPSSSSASVAPDTSQPPPVTTRPMGAAHPEHQPTATAVPSATGTGTASSDQPIKRTLARYVAAYDSRDPAGLGRLFTAELTRSPGDGTSETRPEALAAYEKQFVAVRHPRYQLANVTVEPGNRASAHYVIFNGARQLSEGAIAFTFTHDDPPLIRAIDITPGAPAQRPGASSRPADQAAHACPNPALGAVHDVSVRGIGCSQAADALQRARPTDLSSGGAFTTSGYHCLTVKAYNDASAIRYRCTHGSTDFSFIAGD